MASPALLQPAKDNYPNKAFSESAYDANFKSTFEKILDTLGEGFESEEAVIKFEPSKHLKYYSSDPVEKHKFNSTRRITMEELGVTNKKQISPIGVSDPFPLFTDEAVQIMRKEILKKETFLKYARTCFNSTSGLDCNLRGYVKNGDVIDTPFIYEAWTHPKTMELVSMMAGVDLEIVMDYEIAHVNIGMKSEKQAEDERKNASKRGAKDGSDISAIVDWHYDSYPFVCVLMLSDTTNMIGGETSLRMGKVGNEPQQMAIVPGPQQGNAAVLQGRFIEHIAPLPLGASERITMVTSYRAKNPLINDDSVLSTVKPEINFGSRYNDFYSQWVKYRSELIKKRLDHLNEKIDAENKKGETFDKEGCMDFLKETEAYLAKTYKEMELSDAEWAKIIKRS